MSHQHKSDNARGMYGTNTQTEQPLKIEACAVNIQDYAKQTKQTPSHVHAKLNINNLSVDR